MKKIDSYIVRKFLGTFLYAIALIIIIVIIFDISEKYGEFIEKKAPLKSIIFDYYVNFIPYFVNMFSALFTFIAVVYFTSRMAANSEIIAIFNTGVSFTRFLMPFFASALLIGLLNLYLANFLMPKVNVTRLNFEEKYIKRPYYNTGRNIHFQYDGHSYYYAASFDNLNNIARQFSMEKMNDAGVYYKMTARSAQFDSASNDWYLSSYYERVIDSTGEKIIRGDAKSFDLPVRPKDFNIGYANVASMTYPALKQFIADEKAKGSNMVKFYEYEKHQRISHPFSTIILTLIGVTLCCRKTRGGLGMNLAIGISIAFLFILFLQISKVFATFGSFPVWLAAWLPIIIFGIGAIILAYKTPK